LLHSKIPVYQEFKKPKKNAKKEGAGDKPTPTGDQNDGSSDPMQ
jgi:hypothetical protein